VLRLAAGRPGFLPFVINLVDAVSDALTFRGFISREIRQFKIKVPEGQQGITFLDGVFAVFEIVSQRCTIRGL
jgi:hypothetical protein